MGRVLAEREWLALDEDGAEALNKAELFTLLAAVAVVRLRLASAISCEEGRGLCEARKASPFFTCFRRTSRGAFALAMVLTSRFASSPLSPTQPLAATANPNAPVASR